MFAYKLKIMEDMPLKRDYRLTDRLLTSNFKRRFLETYYKLIFALAFKNPSTQCNNSVEINV